MPDAITAKALREKRAPLATRIKEMADKANAEGRDFNGEEKPNWEQLNKDYDLLASQIQNAERAEKVSGDQTAPAPILPGREDVDHGKEGRDGDDDDENSMSNEELGINTRNVRPEVFALAMQGWMRYQQGLDLKENHIKAARIAGVNPRSRNLDLAMSDTRQYRRAKEAHEKRTMSAVDASAGASTIAPEFVSSFERAMLAYGGVRSVADVIRTNTGAEMTWPTTNDTTNEGHLITENTAVANTDVTTGAITWSAYKFTSDVIKVPVELLEDSAFDLVSVIGEMCGERIARGTNRKYTVGSAAGQPNGVVPAASTGVTTASSTAIAADEIFALVHSLDPAYRNGASFMFHDNILLAIRKMKDGEGRYIWQAGLQDFEPDRLLGYGYTINQHMASTIATTTKTMLFGQLNKYKIRDVRALRMRRLVERYADADQEGFVAFFRTDGNLLNAGTNPVKLMVQV